MKKVRVDQKKCIGCGTCAALAPNKFKLDEKTGKAVVLDAGEEGEEVVQEAINSCPVQAISWEE